MHRRTEEGPVSLDPNGIATVMDAISHPFAPEVSAMLCRCNSKEAYPRINDIVNCVCHRCGVRLSFVWAWMCSDFPFSSISPSTWESVTISYIEDKLEGVCFHEMESIAIRVRSIGCFPSIRSALKQQRMRLGVSLLQMAVRLGVGRNDVASLEHGCFPLSTPRCHTLNMALKGYEIHPIRLLQLSFLVVAHPIPLNGS